MEGCDRPSLNASNEDSIGIVLVLLNEVARSLFGGDSNQRNSLARRGEIVSNQVTKNQDCSRHGSAVPGGEPTEELRSTSGRLSS